MTNCLHWLCLHISHPPMGPLSPLPLSPSLHRRWIVMVTEGGTSHGKTANKEAQSHSYFSPPPHSYTNILSRTLISSFIPTHGDLLTFTFSLALPPPPPPPPPSFSSLFLLCPSQESGTSCSFESKRVWLRSRHDNLSAVVSHLSPGPEKLLKAMETRNLVEFV